jgi:acyl carrier protein
MPGVGARRRDARIKAETEPMTESVTEDLLSFFENECYLDRSGIAPDTSLFASGTLSSLDFIDLIAFLESTYGLSIPSEEATLDNLDTLAVIAAFVDARR